MPNIIPYGFRDLRDLAASRIEGQLIEAVDTAIQETVDFHNREMDTLLELFVRRTTEFKERFRSAVQARLQPLDEHGRARKVRPGNLYDIELPLQSGGIAEGATEEMRAMETVGDAMQLTATMTLADKNWMRDHILAALFANATWTFPDPVHGDLTVRPLALASDNVEYLQANGQAATHTAHRGQADPIDDTHNPFPTIYRNLTRFTVNGGQVVSLIPTNLVDDVTALALFRDPPDAMVQPAQGEEVLTGSLTARVPGEVIGYMRGSRVWIVHWDRLPDNYVVSLATEGERPVAMREHPVAALQGFRRAGQRNDYPYFETQFKRTAGFGSWNRVGADVLEVGDATYDVPAGYESPMP
jgi:hypothetical protein